VLFAKPERILMRLFQAAMIGAMVLGLAACHQEGPAERAGHSIDNAGKNLSDTLNPPQGPAQSTGRKIDRAVGD
jgi:hypothetical protein